MLRAASAVLPLLLLVTAAVAPALAGDDRKELTPFIGYRFGGDFRASVNGQVSDVDVKDSEDYGLIFGFPTSDETKVEFLVSTQSTDIETNGLGGFQTRPIDISYFHVGAVYQPSLDENTQPFVGASLGVTYFKPSGEGGSSETDFSFSFGGGVKFFFNDHVGIRLEGRAYGTITNGNGGIYCSGGCTIGFSGSAFWQLEANAGLIIAFGDL